MLVQVIDQGRIVPDRDLVGGGVGEHGKIVFRNTARSSLSKSLAKSLGGLGILESGYVLLCIKDGVPNIKSSHLTELTHALTVRTNTGQC